MTNVGNMTAMSNTCFRCHHSRGGLEEPRRYQERNRKLQRRVEQGDHDEGQHRKAFKRRNAAFVIGEDLIKKVNNIINFSQLRLEEQTQTSMKKIAHIKMILFTLVPLGPLLADRPRLSLHQRYYAAFGLNP